MSTSCGGSPCYLLKRAQHLNIQPAIAKIRHAHRGRGLKPARVVSGATTRRAAIDRRSIFLSLGEYREARGASQALIIIAPMGNGAPPMTDIISHESLTLLTNDISALSGLSPLSERQRLVLAACQYFLLAHCVGPARRYCRLKPPPSPPSDIAPSKRASLPPYWGDVTGPPISVA